MNADSRSIMRRFRRLKSTRDGYWRNLWREVRRYCMPDSDVELPKGSIQNNARLFDTTAIEARNRLASGMYTWMAPGDRKWFRLIPEDKSIAKVPAVFSWFSEATDALTEALAQSNFGGELLKALNDLACGMDCVLYAEEAEGRLNFRCHPIEDVCYCLDESDRVSEVFREFRMTARQMADYFDQMGGAEVPSAIRDEAESEDRCDTEHVVLHAVMRRRDCNPDALGVERMPYRDIFIDEKTEAVIREGGYEEMPYAICRFRKSSREQYGRGPGIDMLPDIRQLNAMREAFTRNAEFSADPQWLIPENSLLSRNFSRAPGSLIYFRPGLGNMLPQPVQRGNNAQLDAQIIEGERARIKAGFYWDVFDPLGDLRNMTAQEATIRNESKLVPFGPIACNIHNDLFAPILERAFGLLARSGRVPPAPAQVMFGGSYRVEFMSRIALAVKRQSALGWLQTEATLQGMAATDPTIMDNFDRDQIVRDIAEANGCDSSWIVRTDKRDEARQARAEAQAQAQQQQMLQGVASSASGLSKAPEPGSPMQGIMNFARQQAGGEA